MKDRFDYARSRSLSGSHGLIVQLQVLVSVRVLRTVRDVIVVCWSFDRYRAVPTGRQVHLRANERVLEGDDVYR